MLRNKKGELTTNEILEIVLAAAGIVILFILLYNLISPIFNKEEKTSESYFDSFIEAVGMADKGGTGTFSMWQSEEGVEYYLIYFKDSISYNDNGREFFSMSRNEDHICLCYSKKENVCNFCENLKYPVKLGETEDFTQFSLKQGDKVDIIKLKNENFYRFNLVE